ncbi:hypothetical protein VB780_07785 [Leptolyngbya sp. CCNP1308]|uniref:hypothetical protein n=1 Tax=Leptolyngbya sp. CCNP1308 TaxID=3110255 RepID=UPI002B205BF4|nr:hypothetical protein [Leptolyngbya sp. CCNP1308]MEA5448462.1 hypothetical protein [Leptolyngbya sp. CCNP1308]
MLTNDAQDNLFDQSVKTWILEALDKGINCFDDLVLTLPSIDPTYVFRVLNQIHQSLPGYRHLLKQIMVNAKAQNPPFSRVPVKNLLPPPHPLDYDWRFSPEAVEKLLHHCIRVLPFNGTIALLGTPSLVQPLASFSCPYHTVLLDSNHAASSHLKDLGARVQTLTHNLLEDPLPNFSANVVVLDPPWYPEYIHSFLWSASQLCTINGYVFASLPPIGTRPGIQDEWNKTLASASLLGLRLLDLQELSLSYTTPPFEKNVFRFEGIPVISSNWRRGNLAIFVKEKRTLAPRPSVPSYEKPWIETQPFGVRIRIRHWEMSHFEDPSLVSIIPNDVLTSVSRRDPHRKLVDIWTSGNRIFKCKGRGVLFQILKSITGGHNPLTFIEESLNRPLDNKEAQLVFRTREQVLTLARTEQKENLLCGYYWRSDTRISLAVS